MAFRRPDTGPYLGTYILLNREESRVFDLPPLDQVIQLPKLYDRIRQFRRTECPEIQMVRQYGGEEVPHVLQPEPQ